MARSKGRPPRPRRHTTRAKLDDGAYDRIRMLRSEPPARPSHRSATSRRRLVWYGVVVFLSSAFLLVLEIVAGRLLAPYVGVSLYTWTSIIGVILAGLSLGNWLGGRLADRGAGEAAVGIVLAAGALSCFAVLLLLTLIAPLLQIAPVSLLGASLIYVVVLFFVPATLLGIVTPLVITLALRLDVRTGRTVGRMHALSALGAILGTFLTGYWLVQTFGTRNIIIAAALGLFALAVPFLRGAGRATTVVVALAAAIAVLTAARHGFANPCERESRYYCLRVVDDTSPYPGTARTLVLDHLVHSTNHETRPDLLLAPYTHAMDELVGSRFAERRDGLRYFFAGGGGYTQPRAILARTPDAHITVAEIDPAVTAIAVARLFVDLAGLHVVHADARHTLSTTPEHSFDVVVTDVFHDIAVPYHLVTREYARLVKSRLREDGLYLTNVVDAFPDPRLLKAMMRTLSGEFEHVDVWLETPPTEPTRLAYVVSAYDGARLAPSLQAQHGPERTWYRVTDVLAGTGTPLESLPELTDNFAPVERLIAKLLLTRAGS